MTSLVLKDTPGLLRGDLRLLVRDAKTREPIRQLLIKNTITYSALDAFVHLLAQLTGHGLILTDFKIATLKVGTSATPPVRTQTNLLIPVFSISLSDVPGEDKILSAAPYMLKILTTLEAGDGNGNTLYEAGLFFFNGVMFARQTHPGIPKSSAIVVDYDWRIEFTA